MQEKKTCTTEKKRRRRKGLAPNIYFVLFSLCSSLASFNTHRSLSVILYQCIDLSLTLSGRFVRQLGLSFSTSWWNHGDYLPLPNARRRLSLSFFSLGLLQICIGDGCDRLLCKGFLSLCVRATDIKRRPLDDGHWLAARKKYFFLFSLLFLLFPFPNFATHQRRPLLYWFYTTGSRPSETVVSSLNSLSLLPIPAPTRHRPCANKQELSSLHEKPCSILGLRRLLDAWPLVLWLSFHHQLWWFVNNNLIEGYCRASDPFLILYSGYQQIKFLVICIDCWNIYLSYCDANWLWLNRGDK